MKASNTDAFMKKDSPIRGKAGGDARSKVLPVEEKIRIAKLAARARWSGERPALPYGVRRAWYGSPDKLLKIGNVSVECYVLEDGTRVLSGRGMQEAVGLGGEASSHGSKLRHFVGTESIKQFINKELAMALESPMRFVRPGRGGVPAIAFEATLLIDLCDAILKANNSHLIRPRQFHMVLQAQAITLSFAKAGIISAIDEVTGYQEVRERDAIQKIVDKYLRDYAKKWAKMFPDEFWEKLLRAKGFESYIGLPRRSFVGHWVNDVVYSRLAPGILAKLKTINPRMQTGGRKHKHTQFLSEDIGIPELRQHLIKAMTVMDIAIATKQNFDLLLQAALPKPNTTGQLPLVVEVD